MTTFTHRHIGPRLKDTKKMLETLGCDSLDSLISETIPDSIRLNAPLDFPKGLSESACLSALRHTFSKNKLYRSLIGLGYYNTLTPTVIQRNILENPGWYTAYTPYQAEISQGRLEVLFHFQTMVSELTGMSVANASLLDEATAAAEALTLLYRSRTRQQIKQGVSHFYIADSCFPQTISLVKTRAESLNIPITIGPLSDIPMDNRFFGVLVQYPNQYGEIDELETWTQRCHDSGIQVAVATDLLAMTMITPPGDWGADVVVGSTQRFGVPLGYGGPHAAFIASKKSYQRQLPGRMIGQSKDRLGQLAYRMALQTREQHIRREKATSNICTAQALLAIMATMYAIYHGPQGLKSIATKVHTLTCKLKQALESMGYTLTTHRFFDTLTIEGPAEDLLQEALSEGINLRGIDDKHVALSLDETCSEETLHQLIHLFYRVKNPQKNFDRTHFTNSESSPIEGALKRKSNFLKESVFSAHHSETELLRYMKHLENKDLSLTHSMIPLGSCTMKLNSSTEMIPLSWPEVSTLHPYVPRDQAEGYTEMITDLSQKLAHITGFHATSLQPNSGAQGEYAGLLCIKAYYASKGEEHRCVMLIPSSAHGTNPASAAMAGLDIVVIACDEDGNIDVDDLQKKAGQYQDKLAGIMITYPSTHGVFEQRIQEICKCVHDAGGQVYMDGANLNAQVGLTSPGFIGADVCHVNLHKTFAIPHGGGGPGMGPICVAKHLAPFLPNHSHVTFDDLKSSYSISQAPWGSASILCISYAYMLLLGGDGMKSATEMAILNANYMKSRLESHFSVVFVGEKGRVAHELILDIRPFKKEANIEVEDVAKRLIDYGFHAPTMSWPVAGTLMIEPTESESLEELDRFCDAMISIKVEIEAIASGTADINDNVLKNAPHCLSEACSDVWVHPYSRTQALFPLAFLKSRKFWSSVARVDNTYGDRHLVCSCADIESLAT